MEVDDNSVLIFGDPKGFLSPTGKASPICLLKIIILLLLYMAPGVSVIKLFWCNYCEQSQVKQLHSFNQVYSIIRSLKLSEY